MVHAGNHGAHNSSVCKGKHRNLGTGEKLLDHNGTATLAELGICHHVGDGFFGLLPGGGDNNTLAQGKTVRFDNRGDRGSFQVCQRPVKLRKDLIGSGGNTVFLHQILGKGFAAFDNGGIGSGSKARDALFFQSVHAT